MNNTRTNCPLLSGKRRKVLEDLSLELTTFESRLSNILDNEREVFHMAVHSLGGDLQALEESVAAQNMAGYIYFLEKWQGLLVDVVLEMKDDLAEEETRSFVVREMKDDLAEEETI
jgi:hypothetical protein